MIHRSKILSAVLLPAILMAGCGDDAPVVSLGIDDSYIVARMQKLPLQSALTGEQYRWTLTRPDGTSSVVSVSQDYIFLAEQEGVYTIDFEIIDADTPFKATATVNVVHEEVEYSPYISTVYEYCPAPGQFINVMPPYDQGDTMADMLKKVEESISGTNDVMISLGAFGGYVTFGFDHTVINHPGEPDFRIWGNAFYELTEPDKKGGSAEPGIVMVSYDTNCNGIPDDRWYELRGSEFNNPLTIHNYSITYHAPAAGEADVTWEDSEGTSGTVTANEFHTQSYYPRWETSPALSFTGSRLPDNAKDSSGNGSYYILYSFGWGYVDNHPNEYADLNSFDISDAVDSNGFPVELPGVDFVRVYTALNQECGWLGETSTELSKAQDLHIQISTPQLPSP